MRIEVCDLCHSRVYEGKKTEVIIKDCKSITIDSYGISCSKRRFRGVICDECLKLLRDNAGAENKT